MSMSLKQLYHCKRYTPQDHRPYRRRCTQPLRFIYVCDEHVYTTGG